MAIKWLRNGSIILPEDQYKLDEALKLVQKYKLDYQQFTSPMQLINSVQKQEQKYQAVHNRLDPDNVPQFSHKVEHGDEIVTYWVEDSKDGQKATRKMIDQDWGYNANPWCLAARKDGIIKANQSIINNMSQQQKQQLGLYDSDVLATAWIYWQNYSALPKRIAFKNNKLYAFSANTANTIVWWDRTDKQFKGFPNSIITDKDQQYLKNYSDSINRSQLARQKELSKDMLQKLANDAYPSVRKFIAMRPGLPIQIVQKLANDNNLEVKQIIGKRRNLPIQIIQKLANDQNKYVRSGIALRKNLPVHILQKLANDPDDFIREVISGKKDLPIHILQKLSNDKNDFIRIKIAKQKNLPINIIQKLINDQNKYVRNAAIKQKINFNK